MGPICGYISSSICVDFAWTVLHDLRMERLDRFGDLVVLRIGAAGRAAMVRCDCGVERVMTRGAIERSGNCGCKRLDYFWQERWREERRQRHGVYLWRGAPKEPTAEGGEE